MRVHAATWQGGPQPLRLLLATCRHPGLSPLERWRRDTALLAAIALGYALSVMVHLWVNAELM